VKIVMHMSRKEDTMLNALILLSFELF